MMPDSSLSTLTPLWLVVGLLACVAGMVLGYVLYASRQADLRSQRWRELLKPFSRALKIPGLFFLTIYVSYIALLYLPNFLRITVVFPWYIGLMQVCSVLLIMTLGWCGLHLIQLLSKQFGGWVDKKASYLGKAIFPVLINGVKAALLLLFINLFLPYLGIPPAYWPVLDKATQLLFIALLACLAWQIINAAEAIATTYYDTKLSQNSQSRKLYTHIVIIKRIILSVLLLVAVAAMIMVFEQAKKLGATLLASAGIITAGLTFAAQRHVSGLFTGLQLAITQPIRINDLVLVEKELGSVEEINLNHVVIKTWDLRRLLVPSSHFIEHAFQNWSRGSCELLGTVFFYVDYTLSIDDVRTKFYEILKHSKLWNQKVAKLHVSDIKEKVVEIRLLVSADDAGKLWDLRCEVREKMLHYIQQYYPCSLPKLRIEQDSASSN